MSCPLSRTAEKYPDSPALITNDKIVLFSELEQLVHQASANLKKAGIQRQTRLAVYGPNTPEYCILVLAAFRIGAIVCPVNYRWPKDALIDTLNSIECRFLAISGTDSDDLTDNDLEILRAEEIAPAELKVSVFRAQPIISTNNPAVIIFTSGSTSKPKAALLSYGNFYYNALGANQKIKLQTGHRWLLSLPLYHVGGLGILFRAIIGGGAVVIAHKSENIAASIDEYGITHLSLVPTQLNQLLHSGHLEMVEAHPIVLVGGAPVTRKLLDEANSAGLKLFTTYGLTEMASQVTTGKYKGVSKSGKVLRHRQISIAADGEILVKGKTLFQGYVGDNSLELPVDADGWFHTGDIGELDEDGQLIVHGRRDNMFISGGENIYPEEIESWLKTVDGIADALVVGQDDQEFGQRPTAFVKFSAEKKLPDVEIISMLEKQLPRYKIPRAYFDWPENRDIESLKPNRQEFQKLANELIVSSQRQIQKVSS